MYDQQIKNCIEDLYYLVENTESTNFKFIKLLD